MSKKSFNKVPRHILSGIYKCAGKPFVICAVVKLQYGDTLPNVPGLAASRESAAVIGESLPEPSGGTWARRNVDGWDILRYDWPKVTKTFSHESPNFGDWSRGSHTVSVERDVWQREYFPAYGYTLAYKELSRNDTHITIGIELDRVFSKIPTDQRELLFAVNVFQEAVGLCAIRPTDTPISEYISSLQIDWEILPVGDHEAATAEVKRRLNPNQEQERIIDDRLPFLYSLKPKNLLTGMSGFARYVGAQYEDNLVVFENVRYGNALYIMFDDWERLSKMTRVELISSEEQFERIVHTSSWKLQAKSIIKSRLKRAKSAKYEHKS